MVWEFCQKNMAGAGSRGRPGWPPELWAAPEAPGPGGGPALQNKKKTGGPPPLKGKRKATQQKLDDEWPERIFHHVGSQSVSYLLSVQCEVLSRVS